MFSDILIFKPLLNFDFTGNILYDYSCCV